MWFLLLTFGLSSQNLTLPKKIIVSRMDKMGLNLIVMFISIVMFMVPPFMSGIRFMIFPLPNFTSPASTSGTPVFPSCFQARYIKPSYLITLFLSSLILYILSPLVEYFLLHLFSPSLPLLGVKIFLGNGNLMIKVVQDWEPLADSFCFPSSPLLRLAIYKLYLPDTLANWLLVSLCSWEVLMGVWRVGGRKSMFFHLLVAPSAAAGVGLAGVCAVLGSCLCAGS